MSGLREPVHLVRWQLLLLVMVLFFMVGVAIAGTIVVLDLQREQADNRIEAVRSLCQRDNTNARKNKRFIKIASPDLNGLARDVFTETPDCTAYAKRTVKPRPRDIPPKP